MTATLSLRSSPAFGRAQATLRAPAWGHPGYTFVREIAPDLTFDRPGRVGLYGESPQSNGSQFFITLAAAPQLDARYTLIGQVVEGLDILENLPARSPEEAGAPPGLIIRSVEVQIP